jgi:DNA-binding NtrC family response regulator
LSQPFRLLVVDDDDLVRQAIRVALPAQWSMVGVNVPRPPLDQGPFQAALVDIHLSGQLARTEGLEVIRQLHSEDPHLEIIAMSGNLDRDLMDRALKAGVSRFLAKPLQVEEFNLTLAKVEALLLLQGARSRRQQEVQWIGEGTSSQQVKRQIASLKGESGPILIEGESGTGKEIVAQLLHEQDNQGPFVAVNVAAIPDNLFESELFGHVKGSFTGADQNKMGLAEAAHGGDLFLDEIEALAPHLQVKLLRFLESGEVRRVGAKDSTKVRVRVMAATNRKLETMTKSGEFREDLLWRLGGKKISLPPLRDRKEDLPTLIRHFFSLDRIRHKELTPEALEAFEQYSWPGNIRELRRVCEQLLITAPLPVIRKEDVLKIIQPKSVSLQAETLDFTLGLPKLLEDFEGQVIAKCLIQYNDVDEVARILKISRSSLYKKIKDHEIDWRAP